MKVLFCSDRNADARVAVLISLYNYEKYICDALDSVAAQTLHELEIIVCNDCSTDNGAAVTMEWMLRHTERFSRMALIENDSNSGLSATRNVSVAYAAAPYVFILDADNTIYPACLERSLEVLEEAPEEAAFVYALREMFDNENPTGNTLENLLDWNPASFAGGNYIDAMVLHRKSALESVGGFTEDDCFGRLGWEDYELWLKYVRAGMSGIKIHQPLLRYRYHTASMLRATTNRAKNTETLWNRLHELYPEQIPAKMPIRMWLSVKGFGFVIHYAEKLESFIRGKPFLLRLARAMKRCSIKIRYIAHGKIQPPVAMEMIPGLASGDAVAVVTARRHLGDFPGPAEDISGGYVCVHGEETDFSATDTVVVAHWDPEGIVDPYVVHMCRCFKEMGRKVVLSSHAELKNPGNAPGGTSSPDNSGWASYADAVLYRICPGYDFTSWKAALHCFPSLTRCNELVLCNDSVFGGIGSYAPMHDAMRAVSCDFWGATMSREIMPHLQSYYLVFRPSAARSEAFARLFDAVPLSGNRDRAISFEVRLALWLNMHGLQPGVYAPVSGVPDSCNPSLDLWRALLAHTVPMLKRAAFASQGGLMLGWRRELGRRKYPIRYVSRYFSRRKM